MHNHNHYDKNYSDNNINANITKYDNGEDNDTDDDKKNDSDINTNNDIKNNNNNKCSFQSIIFLCEWFVSEYMLTNDWPCMTLMYKWVNPNLPLGE